MCVGMMEGYSGNGDYSSEDMTNWLSPSEDELDIVGEAIMEDSTDDDGLDIPSPSVPLSPGLSIATS